MVISWDLAELQKLTSVQIESLYRKAIVGKDEESARVARLILDNDLLRKLNGGLPFDHPIMLEIEMICHEPTAVAEAIAASEEGLPALAGMERRLVDALGERYGGKYTTNHAGRCLAEAMAAKGWKTTTQRPMPSGSIAKSATVFVRKER